MFGKSVKAVDIVDWATQKRAARMRESCILLVWDVVEIWFYLQVLSLGNG